MQMSFTFMNKGKAKIRPCILALIEESPGTSHNNRYMLRSSLPLVFEVLGLRQIFSLPAFATLGLFGAEKTSHGGKC